MMVFVVVVLVLLFLLVEYVWYIVENGQIFGLFFKVCFGCMVEEGGLMCEIYVWIVGQDGWKKVEEVVELVQFFIIMLLFFLSGVQM